MFGLFKLNLYLCGRIIKINIENNKAMKTTISKSKVMKRAWQIARGNNPYSYSFSAALTRAWEVEKAEIVYAEKMAARAAEKARLDAGYKNITTSIYDSAAWANAAAKTYNTASGAYFVD